MLIESEKSYTRGVKFLGAKKIMSEGTEVDVNIYKSRTQDKSRTRFLVWFPKYHSCSMVWIDGSADYVNINDVSKSPEGKNWYSYADRDSRIAAGLATEWDNESQKALRLFAKELFDSHAELLALAEQKKVKKCA